MKKVILQLSGDERTILRSLEGFRHNGIPFFTRASEYRGAKQLLVSYSSRRIIESWKKSLDAVVKGIIALDTDSDFYGIFRASDIEMVKLCSVASVSEYKGSERCEALIENGTGETTV